MHGSVKVRISKEQELERLEIKQRDCKEFASLCDGILKKRREKYFNPLILESVSSLLQKEPDMFTLWNYRREILLNLKNLELTDLSIRKYFDDELCLTSKCLENNPKSYSTWHHRSWVMLHHPSKNWEKELDLCNRALKVDERNFHCWDYRRFVVKQAGTPLMKELEYTTETLEDNFSNFSAWHNRCILLGSEDSICTPATPVSPPPTFEVKNSDDTSIPWNELDLVHNAIFTDPNDQGPWLYYWWLLGRGEHNSYLRELYLSRILQRVVLIFTSPKLHSAISHFNVDAEISNQSSGTVIKYTPAEFGGWHSAFGDGIASVWWFDLPKEVTDSCLVSVTVYTDGSENKYENGHLIHDSKILLYCHMEPDQQESLTRVALNPRRLLNPIISPVHEPSGLMAELDTVRELVSMEPTNKWALLTLVSLLRYICPENSTSELLSAIKSLHSADSLRSRYYDDMSSAHKTEDMLVSAYSINSRSLDLSNLHLSRICCLDWCTLMTRLNLSNNCIDNLPGTFAYLVCLEHLNLDDNQVSSLESISGLPLLSRISVCRNCIDTFEGLEPALSCPCIKDIAIAGNKVAELPNFTEFLSEHPGSKLSLNSLNVIYNKPIRT